MVSDFTILKCLRGASAGRGVLLGFAPASVLYGASFADVLDEPSGRGYQRRFNSRHSLDFRRYIQRDGSATIPLTFNIRPSSSGDWKVRDVEGSAVELVLRSGAKVLSQVDCQHRLGHLADLALELPFMCFVGLSEREEMEIFGVINGKAKGLSRSLLDFHDAQLCEDLGADRPELLIALYLKNEPSSPWYRRLDIGGDQVSGLDRKASLRTVQKASKIFIRRLSMSRNFTPEQLAKLAHDFWVAVNAVLPEAFARHRSYLVTKGVGVYALMELAADIVLERPQSFAFDQSYFASSLADLAVSFDWTNSGPLKGLGGEGGAARAVEMLRDARRKAHLKVVNG